MAFPAYKLIISGARYERVVYLEDSGHRISPHTDVAGKSKDEKYTIKIVNNTKTGLLRPTSTKKRYI